MNSDQKKIDSLLTKAKIIQRKGFNQDFHKDLYNLFWKRVWNKWNLENVFIDFINKQYRFAKKVEPLITKNDVKRDFLEALKARIFFETMEIDKKPDLGYLG